METLLTFDRTLRPGTIVDRPNRFVVRVRFDEAPERVFLGDPGELAGIVEPGRTVYCSPVDDDARATDYDAVVVDVDGTFVSVRTALANDLFESALATDAVPAFAGYTVEKREPALPAHGRTDFRLETPDGDAAYVEVKSCTYVDDGVAKFPDRQTERGRRHLRALRSLREDGTAAHLVFVVQRPDVDRVEPYGAVDPEFAALLADVRAAGVGVHAVATAFDRPAYLLSDPSLPVRISP
ncbi:MAG: DNA/RNA nuclease SfsA [Halolamina sp.]